MLAVVVHLHHGKWHCSCEDCQAHCQDCCTTLLGSPAHCTHAADQVIPKRLLAMQITPESTIVLVKSSAPLVKLDDKHYKLVDKMEALVDAPPSLVDANKLTVKGPVKFSKGIVIKGDVTLSNGEPPPIRFCLVCSAESLQSWTVCTTSCLAMDAHLLCWFIDCN